MKERHHIFRRPWTDAAECLPTKSGSGIWLLEGSLGATYLNLNLPPLFGVAFFCVKHPDPGEIPQLHRNCYNAGSWNLFERWRLLSRYWFIAIIWPSCSTQIPLGISVQNIGTINGRKQRGNWGYATPISGLLKGWLEFFTPKSGVILASTSNRSFLSILICGDVPKTYYQLELTTNYMVLKGSGSMSRTRLLCQLRSCGLCNGTHLTLKEEPRSMVVSTL